MFDIGLGTITIASGAIIMSITFILWMHHHNSMESLLVVSFFLFGCWSHSGWALLVLSWLLVALVDNYQEKLYTICDRKQLKDHSNH
jgi:membrane protein implicated in regulation of membrane protease activity